MFNLRRSLLTAFFLLACLYEPLTLSAQVGQQFKIEPFPLQNELPDPQIFDVFEDHLGFIWIATLGGLVQYDGTSLRYYDPDDGDSTSIASSKVSSILEDKNGNLWIGNRNQGLSYFDRASEKFSHIRHIEGDSSSLVHDLITTLRYDKTDSSVIWIGTDGGMSRFHIPTAHFVNVKAQALPFNISGISGSGITQDNKGDIWYGAWGLNHYDAATHTATKYLIDERYTEFRNENFPSSYENAVEGIFYDENSLTEEVWLGSRGGLYRFDVSTKEFERFFPFPNKYDEAVADPVEQHVLTIFEDSKGTLWIGARGGLLIFDRKSQVFKAVESAESIENVSTITEDSRGNIWVGTFQGLFKIERLNYPFKYFLSIENEVNIFQDATRAVAEDQNGFLLIGSKRGVIRVDPSGQEKPRLIGERLFEPAENISTLLFDSKDNLWIGRNSGILRYNEADGSLISFEHNPENAESISGGIINQIYEDHEGTIWVGYFGNGVDRIDPATFEITHIKRNEDDPEVRDAVFGFYQAPSDPGTLWILTGDGLSALDIETGKVISYSYEITGVPVQALEDSQGRFWIASFSDGLSLFDREAGTATIFKQQDGLVHNGVRTIVEGNDGAIWMGTRNGMSRFEPDEKQFVNFNTDNGLPSNSFWERGVFQHSSGELFFFTTSGWFSFSPDQISESSSPTRIALIGLDINGEPAEIVRGTALDSSIVVKKALTLDHGENGLRFYYTAPNISSTNRVRFQYQLVGYDDGWVNAGYDRSAPYARLDPGTYTFKVRAANKQGGWGLPRHLSIHIKTPWWRTLWAYLLYGLLIVAGIVITNNLQRRRLLTKEREAALIREAELLAEAADERAQMAEHLDEVKSRFFVNLSHEFRTPLTLILGPLRDALDGAYGEIEGRFSHRLESMQRNGHRLHRLINQLLDLAKLEAGGMHLRARETDLVAFTRILTLSFSSRAERENITLQFESDVETLPVYIDRDKMERIVFNLLSNAFKFTPAHGKIRVMVRQVENTAQLEVKDTGQGIAAEELPLIFDRFHQADTSATRVHEGSGIGLSLVKELVALHHGSISATSDPGFGSVFTVTLPLGKDHLHENDLYDGDPDPESTEDQWQEEDLDEVVQAIAEVTEAEAGAPTILIVEDNPDVRDYLKSHLLSQYNVLEAGDGEEGLKTAREQKPDLVISDVMMPKMDGYALCAALKQDRQTNDIPVVLLTARAAEENKLEGLEVGADDYIYKPFSARELLVRTENLITLRRRLRNRYRGELVLKPTNKTVSSVDAVFLEQVRDVIEAKMEDASFGVGELADEMALSRRQLQRRIRDCSDLTASGFIRMMRIERAGQLLKQKAGNVSEVAYMVGFRDARHFAKVFQQLQGRSPKEWMYGEENNQE